MNKISLKVRKEFCTECSLALRRFIGGMTGVDSVDVQNGVIEIHFDTSKISEEKLVRISRDSIDRLGYKLLEE